MILGDGIGIPRRRNAKTNGGGRGLLPERKDKRLTSTLSFASISAIVSSLALPDYLVVSCNFPTFKS